jgi:hypothetical protein
LGFLRQAHIIARIGHFWPPLRAGCRVAAGVTTGLARRWGVDRLEFSDDDDGTPLAVFEPYGQNQIFVRMRSNKYDMSLDKGDVTRLRDWLTEWLDASP